MDKRQATMATHKSLYSLSTFGSSVHDRQIAQVVLRELYSTKASNTTCFVKFDEYVEFWRLLEDPDEAAAFAMKLVQLIVAVLQNMHKAKNASFLCDLVHTLHYVDLMFTFDGRNKAALQEQLDLFEGNALALGVVQGMKRRHFGKAGFIADTLQEAVMDADVSSSMSSESVFDHLNLDLDFPCVRVCVCVVLLRIGFARSFALSSGRSVVCFAVRRPCVNVCACPPSAVVGVVCKGGRASTTPTGCMEWHGCDYLRIPTVVLAGGALLLAGSCNKQQTN